MKKTRKCAYCGKEFTTNRGIQKYCSEECQAKAKAAKKKRQQEFLTAIEPVMDLKSQEYLTFANAAVLMGCSRQYIYKLVNAGRLPASRLSARMSLVRKADIESLLVRSPYHRVLPTELAKANKGGEKKSSAPPSYKQKYDPQTPANTNPANVPAGEAPTYITAEEAMERYKLQRSWLYATAKRLGVPMCRIGGRNYYSQQFLDEHFGLNKEKEQIQDWITAEEVSQLYGLAPQNLHSAVYRHHIPTKREYGVTYYAKSSFEALKRPDIINDDRYCTTQDAARKFGLTSTMISVIVKTKQLTKVRVGVRNMLLKSEIDAVMSERMAQYGSYRIF